MTTSSEPRPTTRADLLARLDEVSLLDAHRLRRRLEGGRRRGRGRGSRAGSAPDLDRLAADVATAQARVAHRRGVVPELRYPEQLPVVARREDIAAAIAEHQVVVVAGETGSGKTTQLPKICLELGRGVRGTIGHTQPRRIAARTVAERIAEELEVDLGGAVGYAVRFTDQVSDDTLVKLMTDGILLAEIQRDPMLWRYDTLIIDEAHERSLNIDFLLGYLATLLPRRPDLKVVITSATIDPQRFAAHFSRPGAPVPVVEVSGRTFPVEVRYRPLTELRGDELVDRDPVEAVGDAVAELFAAGDGDVLVFLSGEREIRDTADALRERGFPATEVLPLYARLSAAEQHRVFERPPAGVRRRVVLATNVAETSLTVPGIRYVVDPGTARISRYSLRTKVQRLPIEPVSQASARQRAGRCGRVADGICIRLYAEDDFDARPEFTDPEILRTNLASVILQMASLRLGAVADFPFVDPPDPRAVRDGVALLTELGALETGGEGGSEPGAVALTAIGRELAALPVDPRMARMLLAANATGCLREVLVIVSAMSIQDVRERPEEHRAAADARHARFTDPTSDFLAYLNLWRHLRAQRDELSSNQFRRQCKADFLHWLRIREWQDLHGQLRQICAGLGWDTRSGGGPDGAAATAAPDTVHKALLAGLLSHVGLREGETREYLGARGAHFAVFPGSSLARKQPRFAMVGELVETSRLWGRTVARIDPLWAEEAAPHLVRRSHSEPHWSIKRGAAMATEKVTLFGVPLVTDRLVPLHRVDPVTSRDLFLRHALVQGDWRTRHRFFHANRALLDDVGELETRARRRDILVDDDTLHAFYDARVPAEVVSARHFDSWWKKASRSDPDLLTFTPEVVTNPAAAAVAEGDFPTAWAQGELRLDLHYAFDPASPHDGISVDVPVDLLNQVRDTGFDWLVPGLREELFTALVRSLPKGLRRTVVPAPDFARAALARVTPRSAPVPVALATALKELGGSGIDPSDFDLTAVPAHLRMHVRVLDAHGRVVGEGEDLTALQEQLRSDVREAVAGAVGGVERTGLTAWPDDLAEVPRTVSHEAGGRRVVGYPALVDTGAAVDVRVLASPAEQAAAMAAGTRRLLLLGAGVPGSKVLAGLGNAAKLALSQNPHGGLPALVTDCTGAAVDALLAEAGGPVWTRDEFRELLTGVRAVLPARARAALDAARPVLAEASRVRLALTGVSGPVGEAVAADVTAQLAELVPAGFVTDVGVARLPDVARYLQAALRRVEALPASAARDTQGRAVLAELAEEFDHAVDALPVDRRASAEVDAIWWQLQELRVSLFAQTLRTAVPVSPKRIRTALAALR
ncbi:ATP-dependent RNA helicase HrpA [Rhodococcus aerolatus]